MKPARLLMTSLFTLLLALTSAGALAQGKFVYTNNDRKNHNSVSGFKVKADGRLELLPGMPVPTGDGGGAPLSTLISTEKIVATAKGPYLFVANDEEQTITVFKIDPASGALTQVETEDIGGGGNEEGISLTISPNEQYLYAANPNHDRIHALRIFDDGTLAEIGITQLPGEHHPIEMQVSPNGKFLAVTIFRNNIDLEGRLAMFAIGNIGQLEEVPGSPFQGSDVGRIGNHLFNCEGNLLYVAKEFSSKVAVDVFSVAQNGALSLIDGAPFVFNIDAGGNQIAMTPNGRYLFVNNQLNEITVLKIKYNGHLELIVFPSYTTTYENGITDMVVDPNGKFLFVSYSNQRLEPLAIAPTGQLSTLKESLVGTNEDNGAGQSGLDSFVAFPLPKKCQIKVPDDIEVNNAQFVCGNDVDYVAAICGDDCGTVTCDPPSGFFFPVGTTTVTCSAEGVDDAQFTITVKDIDAPKATHPEDITVSTDANKCSAKVTFEISATDFCDANPTIEIDFPSGTEFPKGQTTVHITATDQAGNVANYSFKVTVADSQAPSINCNADVNVNNAPNQCGASVNYQLPSVSDNCPNVAAPSCNPPSGSFFPIGTTNVNCSVLDQAGNQAQCSFKVTVKDVQAPTIQCPADKIGVTSTPCDTSSVVNYPAPTVGDNCPNNLQVVCSPASGTVFPVGTTKVTCTVTDGGGNQSQCSFNVTIFNVWLQDESSPSTVLMFNSLTGAYRLCYPGLNQPVTGVGTVMKQGCSASLTHNTAERRLTATLDGGLNKGNATYQSPPGSVKATIIDKNVLNNSSMCQ